jgi:hypothetical protein
VRIPTADAAQVDCAQASLEELKSGGWRRATIRPPRGGALAALVPKGEEQLLYFEFRVEGEE